MVPEVCAYANNQHMLGMELTHDPRHTSFFKAMQRCVQLSACDRQPVHTSSSFFDKSESPILYGVLHRVNLQNFLKLQFPCSKEGVLLILDEEATASSLDARTAGRRVTRLMELPDPSRPLNGTEACSRIWCCFEISVALDPLFGGAPREF